MDILGIAQNHSYSPTRICSNKQRKLYLSEGLDEMSVSSSVQHTLRLFFSARRDSLSLYKYFFSGKTPVNAI